MQKLSIYYVFIKHTERIPKYNMCSRRCKLRNINVSEAARQIGCSERWLRDSEAKGKIPKAKRDINNWRIYTDEDIGKIKTILVPK